MRRVGLMAAVALALVVALPASAQADPAYRFHVTATKTTSVKHGNYVVSRGLLSSGKVTTGKSRAKVHRGTNPRLSIRSVFSEGVIRAHGRFTDHGKNLVLPIVGGNGTFREATGSLRILPVSKGTARWTFVLDSFG